MMKATTRLYAWRRTLCAASAKFLAAGLFFSVCLSANAQRDIFNWEFSGSFAAINSGDFELPEEPSLFAAGGRLQRNLGNAWQVGLHVGHFNFGESAQLERTYAGLSAAYFWDNGVLLKKRAFITPYHLVDVGIFGRADVEGASVMEQSSAAGLENGLKFRFGDRVTFHVAYALYRELDSRGFEETFGNSGLSLWKAGLSYHFGAKRVNYNGPVFDASARFDKPRFSSAPIRPILALPGLEPDEADVARPDEFRLEEPKLPEPLMITGVDTIINFYVDTALVTRLDTTIRTVIDTNYATSVDTAFVFRVDSVRGNVLDTNFTNVIDTVFTTRMDTAFAVRMDTMFTVRPDTVFRQWSRPEEPADIGEREELVQEKERIQEEEFGPLRTGEDSLIAELTKRIRYLEGFAEGMSRKDTVIVERRERVENTYRDDETAVTEQRRDEPARRKQEETKQEQESEPAVEEKRKGRKSEPDEATAAAEAEPAEKPAAEPQKTDPAVLAIMERQEELMKTQNALLRDLTGKSSEVNVEAAARDRRMGVGIAPTVAIPVGGGGRDDGDRIKKLEEEVAMLRKLLERGALPADTGQAYAARIDTLADVSEPVTNGRAESDSLAPDTAAAEQTARTAEEAKRDSMKAAVDAIRQRADSISAVNAERAARREEAEKAAAAAEPAPKPAAPELSASYPAVFKFGLNRDDVGADYDEIFDKVAADLKANPEARASIVGFTDRSGNAEYNRQLSERRAQSIKRKLTARGIPAERCVIRGEGASAGADKWSPGDRRVEVNVIF